MATATLQATRTQALDHEALTGEQLTILRELLESERSAVLSPSDSPTRNRSSWARSTARSRA